jgi:hypothetical protein
MGGSAGETAARGEGEVVTPTRKVDASAATECEKAPLCRAS